MASLASVRAAVERIVATEPRLDVVVDNAGAIFPRANDEPRTASRRRSRRWSSGRSPDRRPAAAPARDRRRAGHRGDVGRAVRAAPPPRRPRSATAEPYDGTRAYARAKRAQVALMREWARRVPSRRSRSPRCTRAGRTRPGVAAALPGFRRVMGPLLRTPAEGADTIVWLAADPAATDASGGLFLDRRRRPVRPDSQRRASRPDDAACGTSSSACRSSDAAAHPGARAPDHCSRRNPHDDATRADRDRPCRSRPRSTTSPTSRTPQEWDPGVASARRARPSARSRSGPRYELDVRMGGRVAPMTYRITRLRPARPGRPRRRRLRRRGGRRHPLRAEPDGGTDHRLHRGHPARRPAALVQPLLGRHLRQDRRRGGRRHGADARRARRGRRGGAARLMRIAIIGGGVSGLTAAYALRRDHRGPRSTRRAAPVGGHVKTVAVETDRRARSRSTWGSSSTTTSPTRRFVRMLGELGVATQPSDMSLGSVVPRLRSGVQLARRGAAGSPSRRPPLRPGHWRMFLGHPAVLPRRAGAPRRRDRRRG